VNAVDIREVILPHGQLVTPFLAFDQFEELFTLGRETPECATRATVFISELADLVENRPPEALREDLERHELEAELRRTANERTGAN
jgi:hypothetical protein